MSLLYSILKPIVRKVVKGSSLHQEESYEEFKWASYEIQSKFKFALPRIRGFEFRDEPLDGFHIIVGREAGTNPDRAVVYFPGGGSRKWQLPYKNSMKNYIRECKPARPAGVRAGLTVRGHGHTGRDQAPFKPPNRAER